MLNYVTGLTFIRELDCFSSDLHSTTVSSMIYDYRIKKNGVSATCKQTKNRNRLLNKLNAMQSLSLAGVQ